MKKLFLTGMFSLALALCLSFVACDNSGGDDDSSSDAVAGTWTSTTADSSISVLVFQDGKFGFSSDESTAKQFADTGAYTYTVDGNKATIKASANSFGTATVNDGKLSLSLSGGANNNTGSGYTKK